MYQARQWLAEISRGSIRSKRSRCAPRRLLMPERLEDRNAPGALLPLITMLPTASEWEGRDNSTFAAAERREVRYDYRADAMASSPELHFSIQSFVEALRTEESTRQQRHVQNQVKLQTFESSIPKDLVALNEVFASLADDPIQAPPLVIQPIEPGPEPESEPQPPATGPSATTPTVTGSENTTVAAPVNALLPVNQPSIPPLPEVPMPVEVVPIENELSVDDTTSETPITQPLGPAGEPLATEAPNDPVIAPPTTEPTSPAVPNTPVEEPPLVIQPVITDPESEHNQPSPEPGVEELVIEIESPVEEAESLVEPPAAQPEPEAETEPVSEPEAVASPAVESEPVIEESLTTDTPSQPGSESLEGPAPEPSEPSSPEPVPTEESPAAEVPQPAVTPNPPATTPTVEPEPITTPVVIPPVTTAPPVSTLASPEQLSAVEVEQLLNRASAATARTDAIIAIVDRGGRILGVRVEADVFINIPDQDTLVFAIDGAIAKARTAAFFSSNQAILTSRTIRFISQSTVTQREVEANPNSTVDTIRGPGFVAPIGVGGHFPPDVAYTPPVDLFAIEHTNRDSLVHAGANGVRQPITVDNDGHPIAVSGDDIFLGTRFGANFAPGQEIYAPESYGLVSDLLNTAQSRGIATLPGGVPLYKTYNGETILVGGIGVFFPGEDGYATFEQNFQAGTGQTTQERLNAPLVLEAEYTAAVVAANSITIDGMPPVAGIGLLNLPGEGRIDLNGITLETFGSHPYKLSSFLAWGATQYRPDTVNGILMPVTKGGATMLDGQEVPEGWLVEPTAGSSLTAQQVEDIINQGIAEAERVRAAIRLPLGTRTSMVLAVTDLDGKVLGLYRMPDATVFSIDVAVAKARNVAYYADASALQPEDQLDGVAAGVAFTNRTFRYVAEPRYPSGIDGTTPPPFSILLTPGVNPQTAENILGVTPLASQFTTALGYDAFNPGTNFHEPLPSTGYQNGVVFFPGSTPLYNNTTLVGGFGVSGDGVDQDDVVTFSGAGTFLPYRDSPLTRADEVIFNNVRLPYQKFPRNPRA